MKKLILIVEDEASIRSLLRYTLERVDMSVQEAGSVYEAQQVIQHQVPDLILLDWMLPGKSGIKYAAQLKQQHRTRDIPIIMLTAKAEEDHKIRGLEQGADDYITKPFSPKELVARINAVLRRGIIQDPKGVIQVSELVIDTNAKQVRLRNELVKITPKVYQLLLFFVTHQNRVYTREQLLQTLWVNNEDLETRAVDTQVRRLRGILKQAQCDCLLKTVHGVGYRFSEEP